MDKQNYRRALGCIAPLFSICVAQLSAAQVVTFELAGQKTVQQRLAQYKGNDSKRELALKQMFMDVGCTGDQLSEQAVPKKKQPNVLCVLSGTTADVILVGGHFTMSIMEKVSRTIGVERRCSRVFIRRWRTSRGSIPLSL